MATITKAQYAEAVDDYLSTDIAVEDGRWELHAICGNPLANIEQPDRRRYSDNAAAMRAGIAWVTEHSKARVDAARKEANGWMKFNNHSFC